MSTSATDSSLHSPRAAAVRYASVRPGSGEVVRAKDEARVAMDGAVGAVILTVLPAFCR
jgi:hypothetical protein